MNTSRVVTTKQANADIDAAIDHYSSQGAAEAAMGFVNALEKAIELISEHPHIGSTRFAVETNIPEIRGFDLHRFPFIVFYSEHADAVRIQRALHTARDIPSRFVEDSL